MSLFLSEHIRPDEKWLTTRFLHLRSWGDEFIAYHSLSGDTHLLTLAAGQLLLALQQTPADAITLSQTLAPQLGIETAPELHLQIRALLAETAPELHLQIRALLAELDTLSLIERA